MAKLPIEAKAIGKAKVQNCIGVAQLTRAAYAAQDLTQIATSLEQEFNSLHAQRGAFAAYVASQRGEGWTLLPGHYDDGGISGGTLDRPALQRLLLDVDEGRVDQFVVYKVERLTRSLADFAKLVEQLDQLVNKAKGDADLQLLLQLVDRAGIKPGQMKIRLSSEALASALHIKEERIRPDALHFDIPFRIRKKGVEARFDTGREVPDIDRVLLRNVAKAHIWFDLLKHGLSFAEIAEQEKLSARRVQQLIHHAFLAPDITRSIIAGKQSTGLTTEYLQRSEIPENWAEQRQLFVVLSN